MIAVFTRLDSTLNFIPFKMHSSNHKVNDLR